MTSKHKTFTFNPVSIIDETNKRVDLVVSFREIALYTLQ